MKCEIRVTLLAGFLAPSLAGAHALLQQASPSDGSVVSASPKSIELTFSENARLTALSIQRQDAAAVRRIVALPGGASQHFVIAAPRLAPGTYTIRYRIVSTDDGHITGGVIRFTLAAGESGPPAGPAATAGSGAAATTADATAAAGPTASGGTVAAGAGGYRAVGTVEGVDESGGRVTISHEPIAGLGWPAMTMTFAVKDKTLYDKLTAGRRVQFTLAKQGALYVVTSAK